MSELQYNDSPLKDMYRKICEIGCCKLCALRFLGETQRYAFIEVQKTLFSKGLEENENGCCKIPKNNPCVSCLGLLDRSVVDDTINKIYKEVTKEGYDSKTFNVAMTLPVSFQIRAHSLWLYLKNNFPGLIPSVFPIGTVTVNVKDVWKWIIGHRIEEAISKKFEATSDFIMTLSFHYSDDDSEANFLTEMGYKTPKRGRRQNLEAVYSRKGVENFLNVVSEEKFINHFGSPPNIPTQFVHCDSVSLQHNSIHVAGRYNKLCRHLPQTPWIIGGERRIESSLQEIISNPILEVIKSQTAPKFSASGREDVDVRTLGRGRPFSVEILDPRRTNISFQELRDLERKINSDGEGKVAIRDLQFVEKESLKSLKEGEEHKKKSYCAYCIVFGPLPEALNKLSSLTPLVIQQKTPIRVLHRRPFAVRPRTIHSIRILPDISTSDNNGHSFFKLFVVTQAGTYIKEFVHGDFGRTQPNLGELLGGVCVDILALDVEDVILDWPPPINYDEDKKNL